MKIYIIFFVCLGLIYHRNPGEAYTHTKRKEKEIVDFDDRTRMICVTDILISKLPLNFDAHKTLFLRDYCVFK